MLPILNRYRAQAVRAIMEAVEKANVSEEDHAAIKIAVKQALSNYSHNVQGIIDGVNHARGNAEKEPK